MKRYALSGVLLLTAFSSQATEKENNHSINEYSLRIDTNNALCIAHANDIEALSNYYQKEPIMASINVAPFLENGQNTLKLYFASLTVLTGEALRFPIMKFIRSAHIYVFQQSPTVDS